jgi:hypothetical protein
MRTERPAAAGPLTTPAAHITSTTPQNKQPHARCICNNLYGASQPALPPQVLINTPDVDVDAHLAATASQPALPLQVLINTPDVDVDAHLAAAASQQDLPLQVLVHASAAHHDGTNTTNKQLPACSSAVHASAAIAAAVGVHEHQTTAGPVAAGPHTRACCRHCRLHPPAPHPSLD